MSASAIVYRLAEDAELRALVLCRIGEAVVQEDGKSLAVHFTEAVILGPTDRILIRGK